MSHPDAAADDLTHADGATAQPALDSFVPDRQFIAGTTAELESETCDLLHRRLIAASLVLAFAFIAFMVRDLISPRFPNRLVILHAAVLAWLVANPIALAKGWQPSMRQLRVLEFLIFGSVAAFLVASQSLGLQAQLDYDQLTVGELRVLSKASIIGTLIVIFTYGIFIPNTARRAALFIVPLALVPLAAPLLLGLTSPEFRVIAEEARTPEKLTENALYLILGAVTAIFGTHMINTFRTEAFRARRLNQYRLTRKLGSGGMGEVHLAEHQLLKRPCAIKLIRSGLSQKPRVLARFELEVRATARLSHWNTVEVFDYGRTEDGTFYYVMEYLPGLSLQELVDRHGPLPASHIIYLLAPACDALREAHEAGLIHRDLKPPNVFAAYRGARYDVAKLLDFGLVKPIKDEGSPILTREGTVAGSPLYMAPEQITRSHPPDARTDIYAMGAIAYFLLSGRPPFLGSDSMAVMVAHARDPVVPPSRHRAGTPADLEQIIMRCLEKDPEARFQNAEELARALLACADARGWSAEQAEAWWKEYEPRACVASAAAPAPSSAAQGMPETVDLARTEDPHPTLAASELEAVVGPGPGAQADLSLTAGEDQTDRGVVTMSMPSVDRESEKESDHDRACDDGQGPEPAGPEHQAGQDRDWLTQPLAVVVHLAFAYDIGDEINLDLARQMLQGELGQLPRRRRTPESIGYRPAPIRVPLEPRGINLPVPFLPVRDPRAELTLFDFGAISLAVQFPLWVTPRALLQLAGSLAEPAPLNEAARALLAPWIERLAPSVYDFAYSAMSEEYIVFQLSERTEKWLEHHADWIAGLVRLDAEVLSRDEVREATRLALAYTPSDLVVLDWAAGFVADSDCADTLQVIEFANVQLLEFRHIDDRLDDRLEAAYRLIRPQRRRRYLLGLWTTHGAAVRQVRELEIEATSLFERVDNALKLIGDHYLSRVFELASTRFHLRGWQQSIRRKLETVGDVFDLLIQQAGGHRMEALEITVVILIAVELALALWRH